MIYVINSAVRDRYRSELNEMYRLRYRVAVDTLGWNLRPETTGLECDEFDRDETVYFICVDDDQRVLGTARLNPTMRPHLLTVVFPEFCDHEPAPQKANTYELSRYLVDNTAIDSARRRRVRGEICTALVEYCLENDIHELSWLSNLSNYGLSVSTWPTRPLGIPRKRLGDAEAYIAACSKMSLDALARTRAKYGIDYPVFAECLNKTGMLSTALA